MPCLEICAVSEKAMKINLHFVVTLSAWNGLAVDIHFLIETDAIGVFP